MDMAENSVRSVVAVTEAEGLFALPDSLPAEICWYPGPARQVGFIEYSYAVDRRYEPTVWKETDKRRSADKGGTPNNPAMDAARRVGGAIGIKCRDGSERRHKLPV